MIYNYHQIVSWNSNYHTESHNRSCYLCMGSMGTVLARPEEVSSMIALMAATDGTVRRAAPMLWRPLTIRTPALILCFRITE